MPMATRLTDADLFNRASYESPLTDADVRAIRERWHAASQELSAVCRGPGRNGHEWRMSVPVRSDDSDILIHNALADIQPLLARILELERGA